MFITDNRMLTPEVNKWKLENISEDFQLWLRTCTSLLNNLLVTGSLHLAQFLFVELLKGQQNLFKGKDY